jgi:transaldolase
MKVFLDSANLQDIEACLKRGFLQGITTNPSLLSKEPKAGFLQHIKKIVALCEQYEQIISLSVEVFTRHASGMVDQAMNMIEAVPYKNLCIKIPMGWDELEVVRTLSRQGVRVNCTCLFTEAQCVLAANAGATYVSIFMGRLKDIGGDPLGVTSNVRKIFDQGGTKAQIIVGSVRHERDVIDAHLAGAHIVTAGATLFDKMTRHPQTTKSIDGFLKDFEAWLK